jgi:hypothetical protein
VEQSSPKICATCVIFKKLLKDNNHPWGENWLNLVTLLIIYELNRFISDTAKTSKGFLSLKAYRLTPMAIQVSIFMNLFLVEKNEQILSLHVWTKLGPEVKTNLHNH